LESGVKRSRQHGSAHHYGEIGLVYRDAPRIEQVGAAIVTAQFLAGEAEVFAHDFENENNLAFQRGIDCNPLDHGASSLVAGLQFDNACCSKREVAARGASR
jgi:hypothetical protein